MVSPRRPGEPEPRRVREIAKRSSRSAEIGAARDGCCTATARRSAVRARHAPAASRESPHSPNTGDVCASPVFAAWSRPRSRPSLATYRARGAMSEAACLSRGKTTPVPRTTVVGGEPTETGRESGDLSPKLRRSARHPLSPDLLPTIANRSSRRPPTAPLWPPLSARRPRPVRRQRRHWSRSVTPAVAPRPRREPSTHQAGESIGGASNVWIPPSKVSVVSGSSSLPATRRVEPRASTAPPAISPLLFP